LVRPQDITGVRLLTVEGELDDISGAGQTRAAHGLCSGIPAGRKAHFDVPGAGHYGIFSGRRWRELVYPEVRTFIARGRADSVPTSAATVARPTATATTASRKPARTKARLAR
jgi:poly(3-hydroxybutyrate) depolymerase